MAAGHRGLEGGPEVSEQRQQAQQRRPWAYRWQPAGGVVEEPVPEKEPPGGVLAHLARDDPGAEGQGPEAVAAA